MTDRYLLVRKDGQPAQIPAGDAVKLRGAINEAIITGFSVTGASQTAPLPLSNTVNISGNGTGSISSFSGVPEGARRLIRCVTNSFTLIHNGGTMVLPGGVSIVVGVGDFFEVLCSAENVFRVTSYTRANGTALVVPASKYATASASNARIILTDSTVTIWGIPFSSSAEVYLPTLPGTTGILVITLIVTRQASSVGIMTWGTVVKWSGDSPPVIPTTSGSQTLISLISVDSGATYTGSAVTASSGSASTYTFTQSTALATWTIAHNLNRRPSVTVVDTLESVVVPDVSYVDANTIQINFGAAFAGKAYLN